MIRAIWWGELHKLWGLNKDGIYNKSLWLALQRHLEELEIKLKELSETAHDQDINPARIIYLSREIGSLYLREQ